MKKLSKRESSDIGHKSIQEAERLPESPLIAKKFKLKERESIDAFVIIRRRMYAGFNFLNQVLRLHFIQQLSIPDNLTTPVTRPSL